MRFIDYSAWFNTSSGHLVDVMMNSYKSCSNFSNTLTILSLHAQFWYFVRDIKTFSMLASNHVISRRNKLNYSQSIQPERSDDQETTINIQFDWHNRPSNFFEFLFQLLRTNIPLQSKCRVYC